MIKKTQLRRKPQSKSKTNEADLNAFLTGSASHTEIKEPTSSKSETANQKTNKPYRYMLTLPDKLKAELDAHREENPTFPSQNSWIVNAIRQQIKREQN